MQEKEIKNYLAYFRGIRGAERNPSNFQRRDDASHKYEDSTEEYYEWWYFDASFSNGYHMVITFHYRNMFLKPMVPSLQFFIYAPDGTRIDRYELSEPSTVWANPDYCDVAMGKSWVKDMGDHYELYLNINDDGARLTFTNNVPPWKPGTGYNYKSEEKGMVAGWVVPVPNGNVKGELFFKDGSTIPVEGQGYHDHNWGNYRCHKTFSAWYWGRVHNEKYTVDYGWVLPSRDDGMVVSPLLIARDNKIVLSTDMVNVDLEDFRTDESLGKSYAGKIILSADTLGVKFRLEIDTTRVIETMKLPKVVDWGQYYFRFLADYNMYVSIDGVEDSVSGEMLHEYVLLTDNEEGQNG